MQKIIYLILISFFWIGCGAQNRNQEQEEDTPRTAFNASIIVLPRVIAINFPSALKNLSTDIFIKNIQDTIEIEKAQRKLLEQIMSKLTQECVGLEECHINANHFTVQDNNKSIFLGEIQLNQYTKYLKYQYLLSLITDDKETITFAWSDTKKDVLTTYKKENYQVAMHYFTNTPNDKEVLYVEELQNTSKNSLMISLDTKIKEYRLRSNYISQNKSASFNILIKNKTLLEENENIFPLNSNFSNIEEGAYVLLSSNKNIQSLNLLEVFESTLGSFLLFNNKLQGFSYQELTNETLNNNTIIPSKITALD